MKENYKNPDLTLDELEQLGTVSNDHLIDLQQQLVKKADKENLVDVAYRTIDTPVGTLLLAATQQGLVRVAFAIDSYESALSELVAYVSPRILNAPKRLDPVAYELEEYFAGKRKQFTVPLDMQLSKGFRRTVLYHLSTIGYGDTESYKEVASAVGNAKASRAVGTACATNPLPIIIPCHRVLRSDGGLGGYLGGYIDGLKMKKLLLNLEATAG